MQSRITEFSIGLVDFKRTIDSQGTVAYYQYTVSYWAPISPEDEALIAALEDALHQKRAHVYYDTFRTTLLGSIIAVRTHAHESLAVWTLSGDTGPVNPDSNMYSKLENIYLTETSHHG